MSKKTISLILIIAVIVSIGAGLLAHYKYPNKPKEVETQENEDQIILGQYTGLESGIEKEETTDEEIQATIDDVVDSNGGIYKEAPDGTATKSGDKIHLSYYNKAEGKDYTYEADMVLGDSTWPEEFNKTLNNVERSFASDITVEDNGEKTTYHVVVLSIQRPGELDDEYVKSLGIENVNTVDEMKEDIRKYLDEAHEKDYKDSLSDYLSDTITDSSTVPEVPEELSKKYEELLNRKIDNLVEYYKNQGEESTTKQSLLEEAMKEDEFVGTVDEYISWYAKRQAKTYLVMNRIAETEGITIDQDRLYSIIASDWSANGKYDTMLEFLKDNERVDYERQLLVDTVLEYLETKNN